jgi:hypothetical protein
MFKKIRRYFRLQRLIQIEVLETLCSICLYINNERNGGRMNPYAQYMHDHFTALKCLSQELRGGKDNGNV